LKQWLSAAFSGLVYVVVLTTYVTGLADYSSIREGDARQTLRDLNIVLQTQSNAVSAQSQCHVSKALKTRINIGFFRIMRPSL
jgi:hypothetical protein